MSPDGRTLYVGGSSEITPVDIATGVPGRAISFRYGAQNGHFKPSPSSRLTIIAQTLDRAHGDHDAQF